MLLVLSAVLTVAAAPVSVADQKVIDAFLYGSDQVAAEREAAVVALLDERPSVATATTDDRPMLEYALDFIGIDGSLGERGRKLATLLVAHGASADATDEDGDALLLHYAMFARHAAMQFLLEHGADPDARDEDGRSALHWVAMVPEDDDAARTKRTIATAQLLLHHKATIDLRDKRGKTPLGAAAFVGHLAMTKHLVAKGADLDAVDKDGYSVLGACKLRVEDKPGKPSFAMKDEIVATNRVIEFLTAKGAKDVQKQY